MSQLPTHGYLRLKQILGDPKAGIPPIIPLSKSSWWKGVAENRFPQPVKLGLRTTAWRAEDIKKLCDEGLPTK